MDIVKFSGALLLLGLAACGGDNDPAPKVQTSTTTTNTTSTTSTTSESEPSCTSVGCEQNNKVLIEQIYNDVINNANTGLVASIYDEDIEQHMPGVEEGIDGQVAYFEKMLTNNPNNTATIKHIVADGDYVAVHWHYGEDPENEFIGSARVDLYKIDDGLVIEQWDVKMTPNANTASGNSVFSDLYIYPGNTQPNNDVAVEEENKTMVTEFYLDLFNNKNISLVDELVAPSYIQHNFWVPNGSSALADFVASGATGGISIFLSLAEGDLVWTFIGTEDSNLNTVDIWRVDNNIDKIVEHWDVF